METLSAPSPATSAHFPFSLRSVVFLSGGVASGAALALSLGGAFHAWDAGLVKWLGFASTPAGFPIGAASALIVLSGGGAAWIALDVRPAVLRRFLLGLAGLQAVSGVAVAALAKVYFSPFGVLAALGLAIAAAAIFQCSAAGQRMRHLENVFGENISPATMQLLYGSYQEAGNKAIEPVEVTALVCRFEGHDVESLTGGAEFFKNRGAWVEKQAGNRLLVLFNAPLREERHALEACMAALEFTQKHLLWRIGLAGGMVSAGISGKEPVFHVNGPAIEEAEAVCRANTRLRTSVLASLAIFDAVKQDVVARPVDLVASPVTNEKTELYELLTLTAAASPELLAQRDRFWEGVILSRRGENEQAASRFRELGDDPVARNLLKDLDPKKVEPEAVRAAH